LLCLVPLVFSLLGVQESDSKNREVCRNPLGEVGDVLYDGCEKLTCTKKKKKLMWIARPAIDICCSYEGVLYPADGGEITKLWTSNNGSQVSLSCTEGPTIQVSVEEHCQTGPQPTTSASPGSPPPPSSQSIIQEIVLSITERIGEVHNSVEEKIQEIDQKVENVRISIEEKLDEIETENSKKYKRSAVRYVERFDNISEKLENIDEKLDKMDTENAKKFRSSGVRYAEKFNDISTKLENIGENLQRFGIVNKIEEHGMSVDQKVEANIDETKAV